MFLSGGWNATATELAELGFWAYVRALVVSRTYKGRGMAGNHLFEQAFQQRKVPNGAWVQLGFSEKSVCEGGGVQRVGIQESGVRLGDVWFIAFGIGPFVFMTTLSDGEFECYLASERIDEMPRNWFPGSICRLAPVSEQVEPSVILTERQAQVVCSTLTIASGFGPATDQFGQVLKPLEAIPSQFHHEIERGYKYWLTTGD